MKKLITPIVLLFLSLATIAQIPVATYEMRTYNIRQIDETTISWELWFRKTSGQDFGLFTWQLQWQFNTAALNGGEFTGTLFTIAPGADGGVYPGHYNNADAVVPSGPQGRYFSYTPSSFPNVGEPMTLITADWKHIATFTAQLSKNGNPHNFSAANLGLAHRVGGIVEVFASQNPYIFGTEGQITGVLTTAPGVGINNREMASHWFSGTGNWNDAARWNNVTTENANIVPGSSLNVGVSGSLTVTDAKEIDQITVANGGLLSISESGSLDVNESLFNDNTGTSSSDITVALWDFEDGEGDNLPYLADEGNTANIGIAQFTTTANDNGILDADALGITGGSIGPFADIWRGGLPATQKAWVAQFSTLGLENLRLSSVQWSDINDDFGSGSGPNSFSVQYSFNNSSWTTITTVAVSNDLTTGVLDDFVLPSALENQSTVYIRWRTNANNNSQNGFSYIDNVEISGDEMPKGINLLSSASGTGSVIHSNSGVMATVQRYMPGAVSAWHSISAPVGDMLITGSDWDPAADEDLYLWDEASYQWVNFKNQDGSGGNPSWPVANGNNNFTTGRGYIANYNTGNVTNSFSGTLNAGSVNVNLGFTATGWNLVGNPYASGLNFNTIGKTNLAENYAQVYDPNFGGGAGGYVTATTIAPGQGFFVLASAPGSLAMDTDDQVPGGTFFKDAVANTTGEVVLKLQHGNYYDETKVQILEGSDVGYDYFDATKLYSFKADVPQISTAISGRNLSINSMPLIDQTMIIPVKVKIPEAVTGMVSAEFSGAFAQEQLILKDSKTGTQHDLKTGAYEFLSDGDDEDRFQLLFHPVGQDELFGDSFSIYYNGGNVYVRSENGQQGVMKIYDLTGKVVLTTVLTSDKFQQIAVNLKKGAYLVSSEDVLGHRKTSKIIVY